MSILLKDKIVRSKFPSLSHQPKMHSWFMAVLIGHQLIRSTLICQTNYDGKDFTGDQAEGAKLTVPLESKVIVDK